MKRTEQMAIRRVALSLLAALFAAPGLAADKERAWVEVKSPRFTVVSDGSEAEARATARRFEQIRAVFQALSPRASLTSGRPFTILAARDEATMRRLLPGFWETRGGTRPVGFFLGETPRVFAILRLDLGEAEDLTGQSVVFHEYVHFLVSLNYEAIPVWLNEGLADFYATSTTDGERIVVGRPAPASLRLLKERAALPLEKLLAVDSASPEYNEEDRATIFYAQSWALVHYLLNDEKGAHRPQLIAYLEEIAAGADAVEAGRRAFGDLRAFGRTLDGYVHRFAFFAQPVETAEVPAARSYSARTLSRAEVLALLGQLYVYTARPVEARQALEEASRLDPGLGMAWEGRAALALAERDLDGATSAVERAQQVPQPSFLAYVLAATVAQARGDPAAAETALERAIALNDAFAPAYVFLATLRTALKRPSDKILPLAQKALSLERGNAFLLVTLAAVFRDRGDLEGAAQVGDRARRMARSAQERALVERLLGELRRHVPSDPAAAARHHESACEAGTAASCVSLGIVYETGKGVAKDLGRAATLYGRACDADNGGGCQNLARMHEYGIGGPKDPARARALYDKACTAKIAGACTSLAWMLGRAQGGPEDYPRALSLWRQAGGGRLRGYAGWSWNAIEAAPVPGHFIGWRSSSAFVPGLQDATAAGTGARWRSPTRPTSARRSVSG